MAVWSSVRRHRPSINKFDSFLSSGALSKPVFHMLVNIVVIGEYFVDIAHEAYLSMHMSVSANTLIGRGLWLLHNCWSSFLLARSSGELVHVTLVQSRSANIF